MKGFLRAGHTPTLVAALLYFDVSFMAWVLLGPLAPFLRSELGLTATEQGLVTAIPLLGGSLFRPLLGMLGERIGGRRTGLLGSGPDARHAGRGLAARAHHGSLLRARILPRHRRRQLRRCASAREPMVSAGIPGARDGHRRRRETRARCSRRSSRRGWQSTSVGRRRSASRWRRWQWCSCSLRSLRARALVVTRPQH